MLPRFEYAVEIHSSPEDVWREFSNIHRLDGQGTYQSARWICGDPWSKGSRFEIRMLRPFPLTVSTVISHCSPPHRVEMINHCIGLTTTEWVSFDPFGSGTLSRMVVEVVGKSWMLPQSSISKLVPEMLKESMDALRDACEKYRFANLRSVAK